MPVLSAEPGLLLPQAELHPEALLGYHHPANPMHPLATTAANEPLVLAGSSYSPL